MKPDKVEIEKLELQDGDVLEVRILDERASPVDMDRVEKHLRSILPGGVIPVVYKPNQMETRKVQIPLIADPKVQIPLMVDPAELTDEQLVDELIETATEWGYYGGKGLDISRTRARERKKVYRIELMKRFINPDRFMTIMMLSKETGTNEHTVRVRIQRARKSGDLIEGTDFVKMGNLVLVRREKGLPIAAQEEKGRGRPRDGNGKKRV